MRITDKNGDHAEAGKIWENWFLTRKMDPHGPKCTQIDEGTCQGVIWACDNFFLFTNLVAGVTFLKVILRFVQNYVIWQFQISFEAISYFSAPVFHTFLSHHCCSAAHWQSMCGGTKVQKNVILTKIRSALLYFYPYSIYFSFNGRRCGSSFKLCCCFGIGCAKTYSCALKTDKLCKEKVHRKRSILY